MKRKIKARNRKPGKRRKETIESENPIPEVSDQVSSETLSKVRGLFCPACSQKFVSEQALDNHKQTKLFNRGHQVWTLFSII